MFLDSIQGSKFNIISLNQFLDKFGISREDSVRLYYLELISAIKMKKKKDLKDK